MKSWVGWAICGAALAGWGGYRLMLRGQSEGGPKPGAKRPAPLVEVGVAGPATIDAELQAAGSLESPYRVQLSPQFSGRILSINAREGEAVKKGQILVQLDPADADAQVTAAKAQVAEAQSRLAQAALTRGSTGIQVQGQIDQQQAALETALAEQTQTERTLQAQIATAQNALNDAESRAKGVAAQVKSAMANKDRESANLDNAKARLARVEELYRQGYIAAQDVDDAKTQVQAQTDNVAVAAAQVEVAKQNAASSQSLVANARENLNIVRRRVEADLIAARAKSAQVRSALKLARANRAQNPAYEENLRALRASVDAAKANLAQALARRGNAALRSSVDGTVTQRNADPGALGSPGSAILIVQFLDWLYFNCSVPVDVAPQITPGMQVTINLKSGAVKGNVLLVNAAADPASRQVGIRIRLENADHKLLPGQTGNATFLIQSRQVAVAVPKESVVTVKDVPTVFVMGADNTVTGKAVKVGLANNKLVEVIEGISAGDKVVTLTYSPLKDGMAVRLPEPKGKGPDAKAPEGKK
ncbi:MAG: efflux RND transporter periplasmic adaptor subunit [Armatimonadetes bacterium]|nr:efflux RND transporter periplasmic adaptor subunit [Armatimonadota bacterium]